MPKFKKIKNHFAALLLVFAVFFIAIPVFAVEVNVNLKQQDIGVGKQFETRFLLNTGNDNINAIAGTIIFPRKLVELKEIKDGNSIINLWVEKPKVVSGNEIHFSGITPGGYTGKSGLLLTLIFQARQEGSGLIELHNLTALRNDGKGTKVNINVSNLQFTISGLPAVSQPPVSNRDTEPPELFKPVIARNPIMFGGKYFLVFATQDKDSGIDHYEICESKKECVVAGIPLLCKSKKECAVAESPYLLRNQKLDEEIIVKAVDKSGNERIVTLPAKNPIVWYKNYGIWSIIILVIVVAYLIWKFLWRKHKNAQ